MSTFIPIVKNFAISVILAATLMACTSIAPPPAQVESGSGVQPTAESNAPAENTPPPEQPAAGNVEIVELDPCKLVTKEIAEIVLGQSVAEPILAQDAMVTSCTYIAVPGEKFVTVAVYTGENARNHLLSEIAQLRDGCQLKFSTSTGEGNPTPMPPEVEALRGDPLIDLFLKDLAEQEGCGMSRGTYSQISELGNNAYTFMTFIQGAVIGVATQNAFVTFLVADIQMTSEQALQAATELVRLSTAK